MRRFEQYENFGCASNGDGTNWNAGRVYNCGRRKSKLPSLDDYENPDETEMYDIYSGNDRRNNIRFKY